MPKARTIYLLLTASLLAYVLACFHLGIGIDGMSDGGGLHHFR